MPGEGLGSVVQIREARFRQLAVLHILNISIQILIVVFNNDDVVL